jgi:hypothetical protein
LAPTKAWETTGVLWDLGKLNKTHQFDIMYTPYWQIWNRSCWRCRKILERLDSVRRATVWSDWARSQPLRQMGWYVS